MIAHLALLIALAGGPAAPPPSPGPCQAVAGAIEARADRLGFDLQGFKARGAGAITGGLAGPLHIEVRRLGRRGSVTELAITVSASTAVGTIELTGEAFADRERPEHAFHRVRGWLGMPAGGESEAPSRLTVIGTARTEDRAITIRYEGVLCGTTATRLAVAEVR